MEKGEKVWPQLKKDNMTQFQKKRDDMTTNCVFATYLEKTRAEKRQARVQ